VPGFTAFGLAALSALSGGASGPASSPCPEPAAGTEPTRTIDRITIDRHSIFDGHEGELAWPYRLLDRLHARTREDVVRRELLVEAGGCADAESIAQTERNLRATGFLRDARVEAVAGEEGGAGSGSGAGAATVDIHVKTWDTWTTVPYLRLAQVGNRRVWTVGIGERNLFGRGQRIELQHRSDIDRDETVVAFREPRLLGSRVQAFASLADRSDGRRQELLLERPFFALSTRWAFLARLERFEQLDPLYEDGVRVADLPHEGRALERAGARTVLRGRASALRLHAAYQRTDDRVGPDDRRFGIVRIGLSQVEHRYRRMTHVNRFERAEDFNLGNQLSAAAGVSSPALGGGPGTVLFLSLAERKGVPLGPERFLMGDLAWSGRHRDGRFENAIGEARLSGAVRLPRRALVLAQARYRHGSNLDPETQIAIGAQNGLRGYAVNQWTGTRSLLVASEARLFVADEVMRLLSFALAVFGEAGYAWPERRPVALRELRSDLGLGLMVGRNRLSGRPLRVDLAYAFNPPPGRPRWQVSAGVQFSFVD